MICALVALVLLVFERNDFLFLDIIGRVFLCGGATYYVFKQFKLKKYVTLMMALMAAIGIAYNPIFPPHFPNIGWVITHIIAIGLFYLISLRTPAEEPISKG
ncbi:MAG: hypothetical protein PUK66_03130 [Bacteroidales bacterium]|nr:hypothetical protein [Bacteroidales bacterium]